MSATIESPTAAAPATGYFKNPWRKPRVLQGVTIGYLLWSLLPVVYRCCTAGSGVAQQKAPSRPGTGWGLCCVHRVGCPLPGHVSRLPGA